jgi:hypothetical protein
MEGVRQINGEEGVLFQFNHPELGVVVPSPEGKIIWKTSLTSKFEQFKVLSGEIINTRIEKRYVNLLIDVERNTQVGHLVLDILKELDNGKYVEMVGKAFNHNDSQPPIEQETHFNQAVHHLAATLRRCTNTITDKKGDEVIEREDGVKELIKEHKRTQVPIFAQFDGETRALVVDDFISVVGQEAHRHIRISWEKAADEYQIK